MIKSGCEVVVDIFCFVVEFLLVFFGTHRGPSLSDDVFSYWDIGKISGGSPVHSKVRYWIVLWIILWFISFREEILSASRRVADWIRSGLDSWVIVMVTMMTVAKLNCLVSWNLPWSIKIWSNLWDFVSLLNLGKILCGLDNLFIKTEVLAWASEGIFSVWGWHFVVKSLFSKSKTLLKSNNFLILSKVLGLEGSWVLEEVLWSS